LSPAYRGEGVWLVAALALLVITTLAAAGPVMPVGPVVEERWKDSDLALVVPGRLELICKSGADSPWGFSFAGFETRFAGPIEIEVTGSGGYEYHDMFSLAALSLDFGAKDGGWSERSLIGLGIVNHSRGAHPPGWGVGTGGQIVIRDNLLTASSKPQRIT